MAASVQASEPVTLNFVNADIDAVARTMATITGRNVVVDPRVKGQLTLSTENPVTPKVAFDQFLAALRLQGFTVVEASGLYKVVPEADAKLQTDTVAVSAGGGQGVATGGQIATQIFKLNFENANNLVPVLRPLISPNNTINANPGNNSLVITDYADNLRRIGRIIAAMDVAHATDVEVIPLRHAVAGELAPLVARLIEGGTPTAGAPANAQAQTDTSYKTTLLAESRSNALIVRAANPARLAQVRALVAQLDQPAATTGGNTSGNIHVVYLKNADAVRLATTLRAALAVDAQGQAQGSTATAGLGGTTAAPGRSRALGGLSATGGAANGLGAGATSMSSGLGSGAQAGTSAGGQQESVSTGGIIQADPATNSLIITAPEPLYRQIRAVIDKLDGRRAQVLIESLIVEVSANKVAEFGIQWQSVLGRSGTLGLLGTNSSVAGPNILSLALAAASGDPKTIAQSMPGSGFNAAVAPRINGRYYLGALANFLENTGDANVLSTPNLLTLDNEEAQIIVGENVPFPTGQFTNTGGANGSVNPFTTVDRKDVGLMLRVRPQINENGTVKLTLYQEVSNVDKSTLTNTYGPSTNKRAIESTVLVDDGSIIVLGGLLEDSYSRGEDKVPLLGDVPVIGNLFRSESRTRQKSNLMVFLRPVVIRDNATSETLVQDRYDAIRALQQTSQPEPRAVLRSVNDAPVLPPLPGTVKKGDVPAPLPPSVTRPPGHPPYQPLSGNMPQPLQ